MSDTPFDLIITVSELLKHGEFKKPSLFPEVCENAEDGTIHEITLTIFAPISCGFVDRLCLPFQQPAKGEHLSTLRKRSSAAQSVLRELMKTQTIPR
jgi:hypothetical protein